MEQIRWHIPLSTNEIRDMMVKEHGITVEYDKDTKTLKNYNLFSLWIQTTALTGQKKNTYPGGFLKTAFSESSGI